MTESSANSEMLSLHDAEVWAAVRVKNLKTEMGDLVNWYWQLGCRKIVANIGCLHYLNGANPHFHFHSFADSDWCNVTAATAVTTATAATVVKNYLLDAANYLTRPGDPGHS